MLSRSLPFRYPSVHNLGLYPDWLALDHFFCGSNRGCRRYGTPPHHSRCPLDWLSFLSLGLLFLNLHNTPRPRTVAKQKDLVCFFISGLPIAAISHSYYRLHNSLALLCCHACLGCCKLEDAPLRNRGFLMTLWKNLAKDLFATVVHTGDILVGEVCKSHQRWQLQEGLVTRLYLLCHHYLLFSKLISLIDQLLKARKCGVRTVIRALERTDYFHCVQPKPLYCEVSIWIRVRKFDEHEHINVQMSLEDLPIHSTWQSRRGLFARWRSHCGGRRLCRGMFHSDTTAISEEREILGTLQLVCHQLHCPHCLDRWRHCLSLRAWFGRPSASLSSVISAPSSPRRALWVSCRRCGFAPGSRPPVLGSVVVRTSFRLWNRSLLGKAYSWWMLAQFLLIV